MFGHQTLDSDWIRIRIGIQPKKQCCGSGPELFEGSGSGINSFGSGLIPNFSVKKSQFFNQIAQKIGIFSTYIYVHIKYVYIYVNAHIYVHIHTYTYTTHTHTLHIHIHTYVYIYICVCVFIYVNAHIYVHMYTYTYCITASGS